MTDDNNGPKGENKIVIKESHIPKVIPEKDGPRIEQTQTIDQGNNAPPRREKD